MNEYDPAPNFMRIDWTDSVLCQAYRENVDLYMSKLCPVVDASSLQDTTSAQRAVNDMFDNVSSVVHCATANTNLQGCSKYKGKHKSNRWWNSDCTLTRDKQRFWYRIWKSCGRPRAGHVYDSYKLAKKDVSYRLS